MSLLAASPTPPRHHHAHSLHTRPRLIPLRTPGRLESSASECSSLLAPPPRALTETLPPPPSLPLLPFSFSSTSGALDCEMVGGVLLMLFSVCTNEGSSNWFVFFVLFFLLHRSAASL